MIARFILHRVRSRAWHHRFTLRWAQVCAAEAAGVGRRCLKGGSGAGGGRSERGVGLPEAALFTKSSAEGVGGGGQGELGRD